MLRKIIFLLALLISPSSLYAGPITFNSALPLSEGVGILRSQVKLVRKSGDSTDKNRQISATIIPLVLAYGITPKLALFGILPTVDKKLDMRLNDMNVKRSASGAGDLLMLARYTIYQVDRPGDTFRIAPFIGIKAPTGSHTRSDSMGDIPRPLQPGTGSLDALAGVTLTHQTLDWEVDLSASYRRNSEADQFKFGDEARLDGSFQYRIYPGTLGGGVPGFLYAVIESNLVRTGNNRIAGLTDPDSGGLTLNLAPGIQYVTRRFVFESVVQLPAIQELNGNALKTDAIWSTGFRWNF